MRSHTYIADKLIRDYVYAAPSGANGLNATVHNAANLYSTYIHMHIYTHIHTYIHMYAFITYLFTLTDFYNEIGEVVSLGQVMQQQLIGYVEANFFVAKLEIVDAKCCAH